MTPAPEQVLDKARLSPRWYLKPLDPIATRMLAARVLGGPTDAERVHDIARLSEGYPWFVDLLARASLVEGRPPRDLREAAQWALAARSEAPTDPDLEALRLRRARCLLAASLTRRIDWDALSPAQREDVARAVGLERWQDLFDVALQCAQTRGILRRNQGWKYKYVTPLVLEREVIAWLLDPDGGHDPGGRTLVQYGQLYLDDFFETLLRLGFPRELLVGMARVGVEDLYVAAKAKREVAGELRGAVRAGMGDHAMESVEQDVDAAGCLRALPGRLGASGPRCGGGRGPARFEAGRGRGASPRALCRRAGRYAFAGRLVESLMQSHEQHAADEEDERRRWGT